MRVFFIIDSLGAGGAERSLAEFLATSRDGAIEPHVFCLKSSPEGVEAEVGRSKIPVTLLRGGWLGRIRDMRGRIRRHRPDLIHTTLFESDLVGRLAAVGTSVPVLTSLVNTTYAPIRTADPNVRRSRLWAARMIERWTAKYLTAHFHAISHAVKEAAVDALHISPERVTVIHRGRDPRRLGAPEPAKRQADRQRLGLSEDDEVVLNVGRQEFQKGQRYAIEAVSMLSAQHPRLKLLIAGRVGAASTDLNRLIDECGLGDRVQLLGFRDDVPELLAAADIFLFPSLYEGLGGALLEAMALELPIVSSDLPAVREILEHDRTALLVPPRSPSALADALLVLLASPERREHLAKAARSVFLERFTLERSSAAMVALYERMAAPGAPKRARRAGADN